MDSSSSAHELRTVIELDGVHALLGRTLALDVEKLRISSGERVFVLGRSGSGKTTLSRLVKGRLQASTGRVKVLDTDPVPAQPDARRAIQRRIAMIDQEFYLVPRMSVILNILTGALGRIPKWGSLLGLYPRDEIRKALGILNEVNLDGLGDRRVETLSGGQRQRTAIARALMQDAEIILADEPVSNLDPELAEEALGLLIECVARRGETLLVNLHQPSLARRFATRIIGLSHGRIVYDGSPDGFTEEAAEFLYQTGGQSGQVLPISGAAGNGA